MLPLTGFALRCRHRAGGGGGGAQFFGDLVSFLGVEVQRQIDAFGLDTDRERLVRLFFQPVLVAWALWSTGAWRAWRAAGSGPDGPRPVAQGRRDAARDGATS